MVDGMHSCTQDSSILRINIHLHSEDDSIEELATQHLSGQASSTPVQVRPCTSSCKVVRITLMGKQAPVIWLLKNTRSSLVSRTPLYDAYVLLRVCSS